jgi:hypothetical protein
MTMRSNTKKRLALVEQAIGQVPIPTDIQRAAFDTFKETGVLPEDDRVATTVVARVRSGSDWMDGWGKVDWYELLEAIRATPKRLDDEIMESLLNEAVNGPALVRGAARALLRLLAEDGLDVTGTPFHGKPIELPAFGSVGLHFMGFPQLLARPPYVRQARRLFPRMEDLQNRLAKEPRWHGPIGEAIERFQQTGQRPSDEIVMDGVLVLGEISALMQHACGDDVTELMARFDEIARAKGTARRDEAIGKLQAMAEAGLPEPDPGSARR